MRLKRHIPASGVSSDMPERAVDLDRAVEHVHDHVGGHHLDHRDLAAGGLLALRCPSSRPRSRVSRRAWSVSIRERGDEVLDELLLGELAAEGLALVGAPAHHLDRALAGADRPHAVVDAAGAEAVLGDHEARPGAGRAGWPPARGSPRSGSRSGPGPPSWPITGTERTRSKPGLSIGHEDHRGPRVGVGVGVGDAHDDRDVGADRARGEPLVAVDHPLVVVELGAGLAASSGPSPTPRARSSRSSCGSRRRAAAAASAPAARRCRARRGSPCCRCRARRS